MSYLAKAKTIPSPGSPREPSRLEAFAVHMAPEVRFSVRETADVESDVTWLRRIRLVLQEHQPGGNRVVMTVVTLDGRKVPVSWSAFASPELRKGIGRILARRATTSGGMNDDER